MAKLNRKQIQDRAREILEVESGGIRWGEILKLIHGPDPETPPNSIHGAIQVLFQSSDDIVKVARGTYQLAKYVDADAADAVAADEAIATVPIGNAVRMTRRRWPKLWAVAAWAANGAHLMCSA